MASFPRVQAPVRRCAIAAPSRSRVVACPAASRRHVLETAALLAVSLPGAAFAAEPAGPITSALCDAGCASKLGERTKTKSGLEYIDVVTGSGAKPVKGFQVTVNYVAMNEAGRSFDSSVDKGTPYDIRFGAESVIPGLDEGLATMRTGGVRRLYIPGALAFPKGLPAAAGRPRIPPNSPVVFDVQLLYIPGFDDDE